MFQVAKANGEIIGKYTTNSAGLATVSGLEDGVYVVTELSCPEGYRLDSTPQNVIVKSGELATVEFQNEKLASIRIKKIDAVTKKGIYGVRFLVKDEANNLIGEYSTDQDGYIELRDILTDGKSEIKLKVEEIAAAQGYVLDSTVRTLRIRRGETTGLVVENTPVLRTNSGGKEILAG
ncbi:MAG: collagen binding domain-containing protein [Butyricicoccaceae bacterium]